MSAEVFVASDATQQKPLPLPGTLEDMWPPSGLMRALGIFLSAAGALLTLANLVFNIPLRPGGPGLIAIGLAMFYCARNGLTSLAAHVLCWGLILLAWVGSLMTTGIHHFAWVALPIATILGGWILGRRMAFLLAATACVAVLSIHFLHTLGHPFMPALPTPLVAFGLIISTVAAALVGSSTSQAFLGLLKRLHDSRADLERAQSLAQIGSWQVDVAAGKMTWSAESYRIFGMAPGTPVSSKTFSDHVHPEDQQVIQSFGEAIKAQKKHHEHTYRIVVTGQTKWIQGITEFVFDEDGKLAFIFGTQQDITQLKALENLEALRSRILGMLAQGNPLQTTLAALVSGIETLHPAMLCSILILDAEGKRLEKGIAPNLPGFYSDALIGLEIGPGVGSCGTAAFTGQRVIVEEIASHPYWAPFKELAGRAGLGACWSEPIRSVSGEIIGTFAIYHRTPHSPSAADIALIAECAHLASITIEKSRNETRLAAYRDNLEHLVAERTRSLAAASEKIRLNEQRLEYAFDAANDGIWDWNLATGDTYVSPAFLRMLGLVASDLIIRVDDFSERLHPDERAEVMAQIRARLTTGGDYAMEFRMRCQDGSYKWILSRGKTVERDAEGRPLRAVGTHTDLTLRKQYEIQLAEARDAAEAASRAKSAFLANMSHELRTPMNGIIGITEVVLRRTSEPALAAQLNKIKSSSKHLLGIINDILDLSKIEADRLTLEKTDFQMAEVLRNVSNVVSAAAEAKGLKLEIAPEPAVAAITLNGDPLRLGQILINLATNAIKFTPAGMVAIRLGLAEDAGDSVLLRCAVEDSGIGIAEENQKRLFVAFEQADISMTRKYGGTGLGLSICKRLVEMMGGEIGVTSQPGNGSTFSFSVRLAKAAVHAPAPSAVTGESAEARLQAKFSGTRILLAEDEPISREVARTLLEDVGLLVDVATDGQEAVELARRTRYSFILTDMQMPNMNGIDATRAIRALPGHAHTPIVAMTANAFAADRQVCLAAGMNDHIAKPIVPETLFATLGHWLEMANAAKA